jgi:lipopolysaccharide exporter
MSASIFTLLKARLPRQGSFVANVFTLMTATAISQVLSVAISPILTRLYTPQHFGDLAIFLAISTIVAMLASWRYELAIMLPKEHEDAANVVALSVFIVLLMSGITLIGVIIFRGAVATLLKIPEMTSWVLIIPVHVFLLGVIHIFTNWNTRMKNFSQVATARVMSSVISGSSLIIIGILSPSAKGIIIGHLIGFFFGGVYLGYQIIRKDFKFFQRSITRTNIVNQGRIYYRFPLIDSWAVMANYGAQKLPFLILNYFFNNVIVGLYFLGYRVLNMPLLYINNSLSEVLYQRYEEKRKSIGKKDFLIKVVKINALIALFPSLILFFFAPMIFRIVFGEQWVVAGEYVQYLTPLLFFRFIAIPLRSVFWSEGKNYWLLIFNIMLFIVSAIAFIFGGVKENIYTTLIIFSSLTSILYIIQIVMVFKTASK